MLLWRLMQLLSLCHHIHGTALPVEWPQTNTSTAGHTYITCICCTTNQGGLSCIMSQLFRGIFSWPPVPASRDECVKVNGTSRVETENIPETADTPHSLQVDGLSFSAPCFRTTASTQHLLINTEKTLEKEQNSERKRTRKSIRIKHCIT